MNVFIYYLNPSTPDLSELWKTPLFFHNYASVVFPVSPEASSQTSKQSEEPYHSELHDAQQYKKVLLEKQILSTLEFFNIEDESNITHPVSLKLLALNQLLINNPEIQKKHKEKIFETLLKLGLSLAKNQRPIHESLKIILLNCIDDEKDKQILKQLLKTAEDSTSQENLMLKLLTIAIRGKTIPQTIQILTNLKYETVEPEAQKRVKSTILQTAISINATFEVVQILLEQNADPNFQGIDGSTVLHEVMLKKTPPFEIIKLLLEHGANPTIVNHDEFTPLGNAITNQASEEIIDLLNEYAVRFQGES